MPANGGARRSSVLSSSPFSSCHMKRTFPWGEEVSSELDESSSPDSKMEDCNECDTKQTVDIAISHIARNLLSDQELLIRRAATYQDYMKQIPIPNYRGSVIPFTSWMGLGRSIKKLYGQPLHYLTNILLKEWDQSRMGSEDEHKPLDNIIHPYKAEATIWLMEEVHRQTSSHLHLAKLWQADPMHHASVDSIFPTLESSS